MTLLERRPGVTCWTIEAWHEACRAAADSPHVAYDFETCPDPARQDTTSALRPEDGARIAGVSLAWVDPDGTSISSVYAPIRHDRRFAGGEQLPPREVLGCLGDLIVSRAPGSDLVVHNLMMELSFQYVEGIPWPARGVLNDTMIAARVLNKGVGYMEEIGLKPLQREWLGKDLNSKSDLDRWLMEHGMKPGRDIWRAPVAIAGEYARDDAADSLQLWMLWRKHLWQGPTSWWWHRAPDRAYRKDLYEMEIETAINATVMILRGTRYDRELAARRTAAATRLQSIMQRWVRDRLEMPTVNPGSSTQMRGILFSEAYGLQPSSEHMTDAFKKLPDREQAAILVDPIKMIDHSSLDIDALDYHAEQHPEHADLLYALAVYRKCQTELTWFQANVEEFGIQGCPDPLVGPTQWSNLMFHRVSTVGAAPGRMTSSEYNSQNVPKRVKMLLAFERLAAILGDYMPEADFDEIIEMLDVATVRNEDEAKGVRLPVGAPVVDLAVRPLFISRLGMVMWSRDLSQVEMVGFAHYSGCKRLCDGYGVPMTDEEIKRDLWAIQDFADGRDLMGVNLARFDKEVFDVHAFVAEELALPRKKAKGINFGIVYGMGIRKLARQMGWTLDQAKAYMATYYARFPEIQQMQTMVRQKIQERGYVFDNFGRRYYLPIAKSYVAINRIVQGWAASQFKMGYVRVCELLGQSRFCADIDPTTRRPTLRDAHVLKVVHDELIGENLAEFNTPWLDYAIRACQTNAFGLKVPLGAATEMYSGCWDA